MSRFAIADINAETLISSCQELVAIYDRKGKKKFLAGVSTSVAEAMRAGICRGMLEEHAHHDYGCHTGWYEDALNIAKITSDEVNNVEQLLKRACR